MVICVINNARATVVPTTTIPAPTTTTPAPTLAECRFDYMKYADTYSDLKSTFGYDEAKLKGHYTTYVGVENRTPCGIPSCTFDAGEYLKNNTDLTITSVNALTHYKTTGINENRVIRKCVI